MEQFLPMTITPIGAIESPFKEKFGTPRQSLIARTTASAIRWNRKMVRDGMLEGFEVGHYVWVVFSFHLSSNKKVLEKVHPPRLRGKTMGALATRTPHRPNSLGLSLGRICKIEKLRLHIEGLDLVHGTPVFDIKPYLKSFDRPKGKSIHWVDETPFNRLTVRWKRSALATVHKDQQKEYKKQLTEILREDPRPLAYLKKNDFQYFMKYGDYDVGFTIVNDTVTVQELRPL
ncbi:MAG: tRNA (N6-threonylcarbamoyladenosine(37)-N6)-methyltransferase TrmO [Bdellovibrionales bacterium]|nr:tRNA (N6-threonylcarbamoyladenosine(37)-N6)-methyltransferase TrmO [Bdellovibrionales bacterium]